VIEADLEGVSFRDPASGVRIAGPDVYRFFVGRGIEDFEAARATGLLDQMVADGRTPPYEQLDHEQIAALEMPASSVVLRQPRLSFVSYPYEWSFEMLRSAAIFHLDLMSEAMGHGLTLKDATAYNVQFVGARPVFIDLGSLARHREGEPWTAYAQFCAMFLNPLLLQSLRGVPFQPWLRSSLEGIRPGELDRFLPLRHKLRPSILTNVVLQSQLQRGFSDTTPEDVAGARAIPRAAILRQINGLRRMIVGLPRRRTDSVWSSYEDTSSYTGEARQRKAAFVERFAAELQPALAWDLGCNRGEYSLVLSRHARTVVAIDSDPHVVDLMYQRLQTRDERNVLPLVMDLGNPSPNQGWDERERQGLRARGKADMVLALALVHHLRFSGNVPLRAVADWLGRIARSAIVEWIPRSDPMVRRLLLWREDVFDDYDEAVLVRELERLFQLAAREELPGGRVLLALKAR
jgi:hypothetical protein